ncbi:MAG TPA: CARDB domain-containing protein [Aggregatilineales bacterium]|nr:CARDB domain-containing protein [Aggregatilineales bacterium]
MVSKHHRRVVMGWIIALPLLVALACSIGAAPATPTPAVPPTSAIKPVVAILSPQNGATVSVGVPVTVQTTAQHPDGITRVELSINGLVVDSKISQNPLGDTQLQSNLNFTPASAGSLALTVIAFRGNQPSDPAVVTVSVQSATEIPTDSGQSSGGDNGGGDPTCRAVVGVNGLNFRQGPGQNYPPLQVLGLGTVVPITGAIPDLTWWQGTYNGATGWLSRNYISLLGICSNIPAVQPPASPMPTVTNTPKPTSPQATVPTLADLAVISITGPTSIVLRPDNTQTATYTITIQNLGAAPANNFITEVTLPDGTLQSLGTLATLAPGQQAVFNPTILFSAPGTVRLTAIIDRANAVPEADRNNNLKSFDLLVIKPTAVATSTSP